MSNTNIHKLTERLQNLSMQRTYAEDVLDIINQETNVVEYQLRVAYSAGKRDKATTTGTIIKKQNPCRRYCLHYEQIPCAQARS